MAICHLLLSLFEGGVAGSHTDWQVAERSRQAQEKKSTNTVLFLISVNAEDTTVLLEFSIHTIVLLEVIISVNAFVLLEFLFIILPACFSSYKS